MPLERLLEQYACRFQRPLSLDVLTGELQNVLKVGGAGGALLGCVERRWWSDLGRPLGRVSVAEGDGSRADEMVSVFSPGNSTSR